MNARTPLFDQCLVRLQLKNAQAGIAQGGSHIEQQALRVQKIIQRNTAQKRVPTDLPANPQTGIPDDYIDRVIGYLAREGPIVDALLAKQGETWTWIRPKIAEMVSQHTSKRCNLSGERFDELVKDLTQVCSLNIWRKLWRYPYDCDLLAWMSRFVRNEVRSACSRSTFRRRGEHLSLDGLCGDDPESPLLAEVLCDDRESGRYEKIDSDLTIRAGFGLLSNVQRQLVEMQLGNYNSSEIAVSLNCTLNAIYMIRRRAVERLHKFVISG